MTVVAMALVAAACIPFAHHALPVIPVFLPMIGAIAAVAQLLTGAVLYYRFRQSGLASVAILALLFVTALLTSLAFLVSLPDVTPQTGALHPLARLASWYYFFGSVMFVVQIVALVRADDAERRNRHATAHQALSRALLGTLLVIVGCAVLGPVLTSAPFARFFATKTFVLVRLYVIVPAIALALVVAFAYVNSVFQRRLTMIRLWLGVVVLATFFQLVLSTEYAGSHFSVGWVAVLAFWLVAAALFLTMMVVNVHDMLTVLELHNDALYEKSISDELTGLLNRRGFNLRFEEQFRRSARTDESLAVLLIDMDDFKRYNDTFGHQSGDRAIASVARVIASMLRRAGDAGARIGGDEFAVILPKTDMAGAMSVAERIRGSVERLAIVQGEGARFSQITVTIGVTSMHLAGIPESAIGVETSALLGGADAALYAAKDAGRNCVRTRQIPLAGVRGESLAG
ncbi:MAG: GGDEF domain-containing protein [Candidatus Eremiobacteraeota bacterium]|nr:GGDEF domain-containing protein [Candidatus Eremiobacteraeota bacterium]